APPAPNNPIIHSAEKDDTAIFSLRHIQTLWSWTAKPSKPSHPPISSIPRTPSSRLLDPDAQPPSSLKQFPTEPILSCNHEHSNSPTILYLAYGSNLCAQTFLGMRGIRPLSQLNVSAPSLDLTFDLPGLPYKEPCFANTTIRKLPEKPPIPPIPPVPPIDPPTPPNTSSQQWTKGLYGVVYEVTPSDYAKILSTEGAGSSYHDILVPCFPLPPSISIPENPSTPIPRPFLARTLYAPRLPPNPPSPPDSSSSPDKLPSFFRGLLLPPTRPPPPAQPSPRYLSLILTGCKEHDLPPAYISYISSLQPYTPTTLRQKLGQYVFLTLWAPALLLLMFGGRVLSDKKTGKAPKWVTSFSTVIINLMWKSYDIFANPIFGDGERTLED
ncbi:hypothetical protein QBC38DRAFT_331486, partial [Podospora fimiseda]